jgi:hypothetical protein
VAVDLRWSAPAPCPDRDGFLTALRELSGRHLVLGRDAALYVEGIVEATGDGFALELRLRSDAETERREFRATTCDAVVEAASVVVLTRILPGDAPVARTETPPTGDDETETPLEPTPPASDDPVAAADSPQLAPEPWPTLPCWRVGVSFLGGVAAGLGPAIAPMVRVGVAALGPSVRVEPYALHAFSGVRHGPEGMEIRVSHSGGGVLACYAPTFGHIDVPVCSGLAVAAVRGQGAGTVATSQTSTQLWLGVPVEVGLSWAPMPRVALLARVGGTSALRRPGFHIDDDGRPVAVIRPWAFGLTAAVGAEIRLP